MHLILGHRFELHNKHFILEYIFTQMNMNTQHHLWMGFLCEYDFDVHYIKGKNNIITNALSQRRNEISMFFMGMDFHNCILENFPCDTCYEEVIVEMEFGHTLEGYFFGYSLEVDGML